MDPITTTTYVPSPPSTSLQDLSAVAAAIALDMKPKVDIHQTQKLKKLVRRNASDKLKLIQMVHDNPILWDSRLPNFKGAEEEKNRAWEQIGKEFNAPGRRVARAFKSLRESYRRELAHVKIMGSGFKPKWSLYEAMDFLRDVIRERKGGSHSAEHTSIGLNLSAYTQHFANNNTSNTNNNKAIGLSKLNGSLHSSFNEAALNLTKCASLNLNDDDNCYYLVKSELDASSQSNGIGSGSNTSIGNGSAPTAQLLRAHNPQQNVKHPNLDSGQMHNTNTHNDSRVSSTRNDTSIQNTTFEDVAASSMRSGDDASVGNIALSHQGSDEVEELEAIDADFPYPLILDSNSPSSGGFLGLKRRRKPGGNSHSGLAATGGNADDVDDDDDDDDDYDDQMMQQHRHLRQQQHLAHSGNNISAGSMLGLASAMAGIDIRPPQTVREVLNSQFCGFITAKLNSMEDSDADNLMNKILMLLVQTQKSDSK